MTVMTSQRKNLGSYGEQLAKQYLIDQGYEIVAQNWRCSEGELDLVALDEAMLVFIEVRTRRGVAHGTPEESITARKQAKLIELAYHYMANIDKSDYPWRIDVVAIILDHRGQLLRLNHLEYAVGED